MEADMNMRKISALAAALLLIFWVLSTLAYSFQYAKFITVQDIEKVTGLKGIVPVPKSADADGDLNFALKDGKLLLSASFLPASAYVGAKSSREGFKSAYPGIGEEAFIGPTGNVPTYILVFRKAAYTVMINTELESETKARLSLDQLVTLAKIIASRM
jgi:hypothetical protein